MLPSNKSFASFFHIHIYTHAYTHTYIHTSFKGGLKIFFFSFIRLINRPVCTSIVVPGPTVKMLKYFPTD